MSTAAASGSIRRNAVVSKKQVLSLLGVVPLGVYVVLHLWTNMYALGGAEAFDRRLEASRTGPAFLFLEVFGLGLPLVVHTALGLLEVFRMRPNNGRYATFDNLKYLLQRIAGVGLGLFVVAHVVKARILPMFVAGGFDTSAHESWQGMHEAFQEPLTVTVYVLGLAGVSYHLANGLYTAGIRWGLAITPAGRLCLQWISGLAFVLLVAMCGAAMWGFKPFQAA